MRVRVFNVMVGWSICNHATHENSRPIIVVCYHKGRNK